MTLIQPHCKVMHYRHIILCCSLMLAGCNAIDCVIDNHPKFSNTTVRNAILNQVFEDTIKVSIANSYMDNDYGYTFNLEGDLPSGIRYETSFRDITFSGTPTELGGFEFRLSVTAEAIAQYPNDAPEGLCSNTESQDMVLTVVQGF